MVFFAGCSGFIGSNSEKELLLIREMNRSLENSNRTIERSNTMYLMSLESKLYPWWSKSRAKIWKSKADTIQSLSNNLYQYIEALKSEIVAFNEHRVAGNTSDENNNTATEVILIKKGKAKELFERINEYKLCLTEVDTLIEKEFQNKTVLDSSLQIFLFNKDKSFDQSFNNLSAIETIYKLTRFQNDIKNTEASILEFCDRRVSNIHESFDEYLSFTGINSQYLKPGQELIITAGMLDLSIALDPRIKIDGKYIKLSSSFLAEYKTKVYKPGKYSKDVEVSFIKPDGTPSSITKRVSYEVANCPGMNKP